MPRNDRTGPSGNGPMTGRQMGYCSGNAQTGNTNGIIGFARGLGRGFRRNSGFGRGAGNGYGYGRGAGFVDGNNYNNNVSNISEKTMVENEINSIKDQMSFLEKRLAEISDKDK